MAPDSAYTCYQEPFLYILISVERKTLGVAIRMNSLVLTGCIGIAGALGAVSRYLVGRFVAERVGSLFPLGTLFINVLGAFLIGLIFSLTTQKVMTTLLQSILATGFLGGFTTYSTMNWEGTQLARAGNIGQSFLYLGGSFALGLGAVLLGMALGRIV
jgi:fluoride exporter